ncbi:arylsulfatase [Planctomycetota bacterium]
MVTIRLEPRHHWLIAAIVVAGCAELASADSSRGARPSVILLMTDDQGYPDMGCHGNPIIQTPNMDKLARASVRFSDFHVNPFCSPTRAALMTGRMSDRVGVTSTNYQRNYLRRQEVLMPEYFKATGYRAGHFGKWHIGANYPYRPIDRGFDEWLGLGNNGLATTADLWDNDRMNDTYWHNGQLTKRPGFCSDVYFDEAMNFIGQCRKDQVPFFTYLATNVPHWDWNVQAEWMKPYEESCGRLKAAYFASISRVDWNLGRLLAFLEEEELLDNTILVFLTDNGSDVPEKNNAFTAGMRGFKGSLYEGGHRVPCFLYAPEALIGKPRVIDALTAHVDLLPTFIDLCDLKRPNRRQLPMDGRSLHPLLTGNCEWPDRMLVMHHQNGWEPEKHANSVVLTSDWRLVRRWNAKTRQTHPAELYRIQEDRGQATDVAAAHPDVVAKLESAYSDYWDAIRLDQHLERPILSAVSTLRLSSDIARDSCPITQQAVRKGQPMEPLWEIQVGQPGTYRFEVRRWPREVSAAMTAGLPPARDPDIEYVGHGHWRLDVPGVALDIAKVQLVLSDRTPLTKGVSPDAQGVVFDAELETGPLDIKAWLIDPDGQRQGAYYVYAEPLQ